MRITELTLTHFRGSDVLTLELHPRLNLFVGVNGSGKSTILDATALLLSWLLARIKHAEAAGDVVQEDDISNDQAAAQLEITVQHEGATASWRLAQERPNTHPEASSLSALDTLACNIAAQLGDNNHGQQTPLMVYYPVNRTVLGMQAAAPAADAEQESDRPAWELAYADALHSGANFHRFYSWYHAREVHETVTDKTDPQLAAVRRALAQCLPGFGNLSVEERPRSLELRKRGKPIKLTQLSDGEKCLMALVGDLARRMALANPDMENPLNGNGVVLIDEIDLHLHPRWQHQVIPGLLSVFPHCQFMVSTHSPHVITHVSPESIFLLTESEMGIEVDKPIESYGKNVERILEDLMGLESTRPNEVRDGLRRLHEAITEGKLTAAREQIEALRAQIGADPELVKAEILIRRKELIGK